MKTNLTLFSLILSIILMLKVGTTLAIDPIKFTIKTSSSTVALGEEIEFTITANLLNVPPNTVFIFKDDYSFRIKVVTPSGFRQTGGTYQDYIGTTLSARQPSVSYTLKGKFDAESEDHQFMVLRGGQNSTDQSQFANVSSISYEIQNPATAENLQDQSARIVVFNGPGFVPYVTRAQLYAGLADTAKVVKVIQPKNGKAFTFKYDPTNTTAPNDSFRVMVVGIKRYLIQDPAVTPEQFGAFGDGIQNDLDAINKAIDFLEPIKGGGALVLHSARYELGMGTISIDANNVHVIGQGKPYLKNGTLRIKGEYPHIMNNVVS